MPAVFWDEKRLKDFIKTDPARNITFFVNENSFRIEGDFTETQTINLIIN